MRVDYNAQNQRRRRLDSWARGGKFQFSDRPLQISDRKIGINEDCVLRYRV